MLHPDAALAIVVCPQCHSVEIVQTTEVFAITFRSELLRVITIYIEDFGLLAIAIYVSLTCAK
jgi:hypothetical protein